MQRLCESFNLKTLIKSAFQENPSSRDKILTITISSLISTVSGFSCQSQHQNEAAGLFSNSGKILFKDLFAHGFEFADLTN